MGTEMGNTLDKLDHGSIIKLIQNAKRHHRRFSNHCQRLEAIAIDHFSYFYMSDKGQIVALSTHIDLLESYWKNHCYLETPYLKDLSQVEYFSLHSELEHFNSQPKFKSLLNQVDLDNRRGAIIVIPEKKYLAYANYSGANISDSFIASLNTEMERFTHNIADALSDVIDKTLKLNITFPHHQQLLSSIPARPYLGDQPLKVSPREFDCLELLMEGKTHSEIAEALAITERTVANHLQNIKFKNEITSPKEFVKLYQSIKYCKAK